MPEAKLELAGNLLSRENSWTGFAEDRLANFYLVGHAGNRTLPYPLVKRVSQSFAVPFPIR